MSSKGGFRNFASLSTANVIQLGLSFVALGVIARYLGVDGLGAATVLLAGYLFGSAIGDFTLPIPLGGLVNSTSFGAAGARSFDGFRVVTLALVTVVAVPSLAIGDSTTVDMAFIGLIVGALSSFSDTWLLLASGHVRGVAIAETSGRASYLLLLVFTLPIAPEPATVAMCLACSALVMVLLTRTLSRGIRHRLPPGESWPTARLARLGAPALASRITIYAYGPGSLILFAGILTPSQLGLLGASDRVVRALQSLIYPLSLSLFPFFAERSAEAERRLKVRATKGAVAALIVGLVAATAAIVFAPLVVHLLYGQGFSDAVMVLRIEAVLLVPFAVSNFLLTNVVLGRQDTMGSLMISVSGLLVLLAGSVFVWGIDASAWTAAFAMVVAELWVCIMVVVRVRKRIGSFKASS